ncbi:TIGR03747 family integrating conjugative element membrane protein [Comamonas terrigena]|uniref:TIGR03747 family integrating conjugative element membrane protein n=1 Tax=Comamonas terrigena TaxID=32013 RepID=UPI0028A7062D|nr:TIGR03747 family integrating conjugative element membrane protein [Comamonas terrigena]
MSAPNRQPDKPRATGPVELAFRVVTGLVGVSLVSWMVGICIEIGGSFVFWKGQGIRHAQSVVHQDLGYIAAAPRSLLVPDTVGFSLKVAQYVRWPYEKLGVLRLYQSMHSPTASIPVAAPQAKGNERALANAKQFTWFIARQLSEWLVISMFVAQDVVLRLCVAAFAMPAFALACLMGLIDGLVRRDLRRWTGGRESSFLYHHAKRYTHWALTGGFGLYLSWPFGTFNPAYMVLVFTILVAISLSTTVAAFKKYA